MISAMSSKSGTTIAQGLLGSRREKWIEKKDMDKVIELAGIIILSWGICCEVTHKLSPINQFNKAKIEGPCTVVLRKDLHIYVNDPL